ncbi:MAG TPA: tyrosine--tRNA ligase [Gaiellales bacterium]|nr:tyrosine--tRNA ligase [Gaiellales bacterium]
MATTETPLLDDLTWRGLIAQVASEDRLAELVTAGGATVYCGFDPTAPSLHVGHLVPLLTLARYQRAGVRPIALAGGGTGMIGDPSGRTSERMLNEAGTVDAWTERIRGQLSRFLDFDAGALLLNNLDWLAPLTAIELLRDVGKHFPMGWMLGKESVRTRIEGEGLSFTEFSYMVLQSYDFLHLERAHGCLLQIGGSDQYGNITAGIELIRRADGAGAAGQTVPLITDASGQKFGKSTGAAVWLDPERTSPYAFYQYWLNVDDRDAGRYLRLFTFLDRPDIEAIEASQAERPERREAQRRLAQEMTVMVHGDQEWRRAVEVSEALFGKGRLGDLEPERLEVALEAAPTVRLGAGIERSYAALMVETGLAKSTSEAARLAAGGGVYANDDKIEDVSVTPPDAAFLGGRVLVLRRGRRSHGLVVRG